MDNGNELQPLTHNSTASLVSNIMSMGNSGDAGRPTTTNTTLAVTEEDAQSSHQPMISDEAMRYVNLYFNIILCGLTAAFGTLANVLNMIIFRKLGLKDSNSVCLFGLALTDFLLSFDAMITRIFPIWSLFATGGVEPMTILYTTWVTDSLFLCSGWIVTFLSLERCVCVISPFKVKQIFTRNRSIAAVVFFHVVTASVYVPIYATHWLEWTDVAEVDASVNGTKISTRRLVLMFAENRPEVELYVTMLSVTIIPVPSMVLTTGSAIWMIYGLHVSSRVRGSMTAKHTDSETQELHESKLTHKTRRLMKIVLSLAIICIVCSIPRTFATTIKTIHPNIDEGMVDANLNDFLWQLSRFSTTVNASVNIFVYLTINSLYRTKFRELFALKPKTRSAKV